MRVREGMPSEPPITRYPHRRFRLSEVELHELRHACATLLLECGLAPADVAVQLGHTGGRLVMTLMAIPMKTSPETDSTSHSPQTATSSRPQTIDSATTRPPAEAESPDGNSEFRPFRTRRSTFKAPSVRSGRRAFPFSWRVECPPSYALAFGV
jgi:hypothetical protein